MTAIELLNLLTAFAKQHRKDAPESIKRNRHLTDFWNKIPQGTVDAVLVDFINSLAGEKYSIDYALSVRDFEE